MSATPIVRGTSARSQQTRYVIEGLPGLKLVPTPAPKRGFFGTVLLCALLVIASFGTVFVLNTRMVDTAYQVQSVQRQLNEASAKEATLQDQVVSASTPQGLAKRAQELGLIPATDVQHLDLKTGKIVSPAQSQGNSQTQGN